MQNKDRTHYAAKCATTAPASCNLASDHLCCRTQPPLGNQTQRQTNAMVGPAVNPALLLPELRSSTGLTCRMHCWLHPLQGMTACCLLHGSQNDVGLWHCFLDLFVGQHHGTIHVQLILQQGTAQQGMAQQHCQPAGKAQHSNPSLGLALMLLLVIAQARVCVATFMYSSSWSTGWHSRASTTKVSTAGHDTPIMAEQPWAPSGAHVTLTLLRQVHACDTAC